MREPWDATDWFLVIMGLVLLSLSLSIVIIVTAVFLV